LCRFDPLARRQAAGSAAGRYHFLRQLSQITKGIKTGQKDNTKPLVDKVGDPSGRMTAGRKVDKKGNRAANDTPPEAEAAREEPEPPKPFEKKPEPPVDQIAER